MMKGVYQKLFKDAIIVNGILRISRTFLGVGINSDVEELVLDNRINFGTINRCLSDVKCTGKLLGP